MTQGELAKAVGLSPRVIFAYEHGESYPRRREIYTKLADLFEVNINYLLTEDEEFITEAAEKYGSQGMKDAQDILNQTAALFAGGELSDEDSLAFMHSMQQIYFDAKVRAAEKFTPNKYRHPENTISE